MSGWLNLFEWLHSVSGQYAPGPTGGSMTMLILFSPTKKGFLEILLSSTNSFLALGHVYFFFLGGDPLLVIKGFSLADRKLLCAEGRRCRVQPANRFLCAGPHCQDVFCCRTAGQLTFPSRLTDRSRSLAKVSLCRPTLSELRRSAV